METAGWKGKAARQREDRIPIMCVEVGSFFRGVCKELFEPEVRLKNEWKRWRGKVDSLKAPCISDTESIFKYI